MLRAFELIEAWGFEYKTVAFYWVKLNSAAKHDADYFTGLGYWTRANPEQCLLATRGKPPRKAKDVRRLVVEKRREHSRKPDCVRERIERLVAGPYLELFARETKKGGTVGAIRLPCSIKVLLSRGVSPLGSLMWPRCHFDCMFALPSAHARGSGHEDTERVRAPGASSAQISSAHDFSS